MIAVRYGVLILTVFGIALFFGSPVIATWFTQDTDAVRQIITALRIDAFNQPGLAISLILVGALQEMGDTKSPLYSTAFGIWITRILGVIILGQVLNLGIAGIWIAIGIDLYSRSLYLYYCFNRNINLLEKSPRNVY